MIKFKTKICGVTSITDAQSAMESGVDAIGLNFFPPSRRCVTVEQAARITQQVDPNAVVFIGVFVNLPMEQVIEISARVGLDAIQFHGDETVEMVHLIQQPVIRAIRVRDQESTQLEIERWTDAGAAAILLDADGGRDYGGTGTMIDWQQAGQLSCTVPLILAGGLTPDNVCQAIAAVRPDGVDVASGVELEPGRKDLDLMREFVANARRELG